MSFRRRALFLAGLFVAVSCSDAGNPIGPEGPEPPTPTGPEEVLAALTCTVSVGDPEVRCAAPGPGTGSAVGNVGIVGGLNGQYVRLTNTPVQADADSLWFNATLTNYTGQTLGTVDGTNPDADSIRVFFVAEPNPTAGGDVTVGHPTGAQPITTGAPQPYYQYPAFLADSAVSEPRRWHFNLIGGATKFTFYVMVRAKVQFPRGWLKITPRDPVLEMGEVDTLRARVRNRLGVDENEPITWSSSDINIVTVTSIDPRRAQIAGAAEGTAWIKAQSDSLLRVDSVLVTVNNKPVVTTDSIDAIANVTDSVAAPRLQSRVTTGGGTVVPDTVATFAGGQAIILPGGGLVYRAPAGFSGKDTITYEVADDDWTVNGKVIVNVLPSNYWYVQANAAGDGRDRSPFGTIAAAQAVAGAGDSIFVFAPANGTSAVDGDVVLKNDQALIGQGVAFDVTRPLNGHTAVIFDGTEAATGLARSTAGATVTLAQNNVIRGLGITSTAGAGIHAPTPFGSLFVRETGVGATGGPALDLTTGSADAIFNTLSSTNSTTSGLALTGVTGTLTATAGTLATAAAATGRALLVSGGSATLNLGVAVTDASEGIEVTGISGGAVTVSGALSLTGKGLNVHGNTGGTIAFTGASKTVHTGANAAVTLSSNTGAAVSFGGGNLDVVTTSGAGVVGSGGGSLSITGANNRLATGTGTALSLVGVGTGVSGISLFQVQAGAGAPNGIVLNGITGRGVQVTGTAGTPETAGTIGATTGHRIQLTNTGIAPVELGPLLVNGALTPGTVALNASGADSIKVDALKIDVTGGSALSVFSSGLFGAFNLVKSAGSPDNAVVLNTVAGTVGLPVDLSGAAATTLAILGGSLTATITGTVSQATVNALLLNVSGGHNGMLTFGGTLSATNGNGVQLSNADGIYTFSGTTTLNGGNAGIDVTNGSTGAITFGAGTTITTPTGTALDISNATADADVSFAGTISANAGRPVSVSGVSGGTVTVAGSLTATGQGISVAGNTGGTIAFNGATKTLTTGANAAVTLNNNTGATVQFGGGNLAITTTTGAGFAASGGGTVQVTGPNNTIASTTGTALSLASVATGASGVNLASVSANGGFNGIILTDLTGQGVQVNGGTVQATTGNAVSLTNLSGLTAGVQLAGMTLTRGGATNMVLSGSTFGSLDLTGTTVSATGGGRAIDLTTGALAGTISAINAAASSGTPVTFTDVSGSATVNGGTITNGSLVGNVVVSGGSLSLDWRGNLSQATNNVALLRVTNGHTGTLTFQTGTLGATDGLALQFDNADGTYNFNGTTTVSGTDRGIDILNGSGGTFSFGTGVSVTNPVAAAPALFVDAGAPTVTYAGTLSTNAARPVQVEDLTGGSVTVSGAITSTALGILVQNNTAGSPTVTFSGAKTLNTGANAAVTLDNNDAATVTFSGGNLGITTTSGAGFSAVNGGTVNVTGANNTVASTGGGTPVNIQNTSIGGNHVTFRSVNKSTGSGYGIRLENTGTSGGFKVTGDGTTANSGGTITQTAATNADSAAVTLSSTGDLSLQFMRFSITTGDGSSGIVASGLTGTNLVQKSIVDFNNVAPAGVPVNVAYGARFMQNTSATITLDALTMQNKLDGGTAGSLSAGGTGTVNFNVIDTNTGDSFGSTLQGLFGSGWVVGSGETSGSTGTVNLTISDTRFQNAAVGGTNNLEVGANASSTMNYKIKNNVFSSVANASFLAGIVTLRSFDGAVVGGNTAMDSIVGNTITNSGTGPLVADRGYRGINVFMQSTTAATHRVVIANNVITDLWQTGVALSPRNLATAHIKVVNNTIGTAALPVGQANFRGVLVEPQDGSVLNLEMTGNSIYGAGTSDSNASLGLRVGTTSGSQTLNATVVSNTIGSTSASTAARFRAESAATGTGTVCLDLRSNTLEDASRTFGLLQTGGTFRVEGAGSGAVSNAAIQAANTTGTGNVSGTVNFNNSANCTQPPI